MIFLDNRLYLQIFNLPSLTQYFSALPGGLFLSAYSLLSLAPMCFG